MVMECDILFRHANLITMLSNENDSLGILLDHMLAIRDGKIIWIGRDNHPVAKTTYDLQGQWISPGLIDCHTHLVFAGDRAGEFQQRLAGKTYAEIAQAGGGIQSTVRATRQADLDELLVVSAKRLEVLLAQGVTTVEIKSGYGLDEQTELRQLQVAHYLQDQYPISVVKTFLGAHCVPSEFAGQADRYVDFLCDELLPKAHALGLVDAVDAFCEKIGFTPEQVARLFSCAKKLNLPVRLHAEQLSSSNGASLAASYQALSADHLEYVTESDVLAMAQQGMAAVLLPGAFYYLQETRKPPIDLFRRHGVPIAIASDANPGSSPIFSLHLVMNMACILFGLTITEAWLAVTQHAATALGLSHDRGSLAVGQRADCVVWDMSSPADLIYNVGLNPCSLVIQNGEVVDHSGSLDCSPGTSITN